ncbi:MAG: NAD(P)-dependent alcohol dehydrogenase [Chloroflexi bacterium]|nr:NAD(P)-dependent alcohol dehydrogenase [Chloroflexota bacterium]TDI87395.1 MAG: NAD(P)-dependent alcohol dehydrogenase [Chloroflexota bacterium]
MKAIVYRKYGSPDVLKLEEVDKPTPADDEVLVKVHAASINDWDWGLLRGKPLINRISGLLRPRHKILGTDVAGRVEAVGKNVTRFQPDDDVFGDLSECGFGGFAEYVCARETALTPKPASMTFEQAAAVPHAAALAVQSLRHKSQIRSGQRVLFNGAGGGAGTFAVQIAKSLGAEVTCVDSSMKLDMLSSLGADHVIDYTREDFTRNGQRYDLIIDVKARRSVFAYRRALNPGGICVMVGGSMPRIFLAMIAGHLFSMIGRKKIGILWHRANRGLDFVIELFEAGKVVPVIDKSFTLSEVGEALRYFGEGKHQGKIVITV